MNQYPIKDNFLRLYMYDFVDIIVIFFGEYYMTT